MSYARIEHSGAAVPTTLGSDITNSDTSLPLAASTGWPDGATGPFYLVINPGNATEEKILATTRTTTTLNNLTRGVDGTSGAAHSAGEVILHCFTATEADEANVLVHSILGTDTTKGDLNPATGAGAVGRLAVGANNTVLVADSSQTTGQKWSKVVAANITAGTITTTEIADGTITGTDIAASTITTTNILDGTIATADLADGAVTSAKILDGTIATADIAALNITTALLAASAVTQAKIADSAVSPAKLGAGFWAYNNFSGTTDSNGRLNVTHGLVSTPNAVFVQLGTPDGGANFAHVGGVTNIGATTFTVRFIADTGSAGALAVTGWFLALP